MGLIKHAKHFNLSTEGVLIFQSFVERPKVWALLMTFTLFLNCINHIHKMWSVVFSIKSVGTLDYSILIIEAYILMISPFMVVLLKPEFVRSI